jgi:hypothetical protein
MRKLKLEVDALEVQTFVTSGRDSERGTVQGNDYSEYTCPACSDNPYCKSGDARYPGGCSYAACTSDGPPAEVIVVE